MEVAQSGIFFLFFLYRGHAAKKVQKSLPIGTQCLTKQAMIPNIRHRPGQQKHPNSKEKKMAVITITSEYFAGGQRVASGIAKKIDFHFVGDRLVAEVAKELNMSEHEAKTFLKPGGASILRYLDKYTCSIVQKVVDREHGCLDDSAYYDKTRELVEKIYKNENAVILGWAAQCILQKKPETFHVLLKKKADKKIAEVMEAQNRSRKAAEKLIGNDEEEKKAYIQKYFQADWQDTSLYDLILDMENYTIESAVDLVVSKAEKKITPLQEEKGNP